MERLSSLKEAAERMMNVAFHCGNCCAFLSRESAADEATKTMLLERQREYKMAALRAKKQGDVEQAKLHFRTSKVRDTATDLSDLFKTKQFVLVVFLFCVQGIC